MSTFSGCFSIDTPQASKEFHNSIHNPFYVVTVAVSCGFIWRIITALRGVIDVKNVGKIIKNVKKRKNVTKIKNVKKR